MNNSGESPLSSIWCLSLLTGIQAGLVHLGLRTVMGTSCLVNKHAYKHKTHCALYRVRFPALTGSEIMRI